MPYWEVVTRSFRIAWDHKYLWLIALFAGEGGGASFNYSQGNPSTTTANGRAPDFSAVQHQVTTWIADHLALIVAAAIVWLILVVAFFILGAICEGATVRASAEHDAERPFRLGWAWRSGVTTMWAVVRLRLLIVVLALPIVILFLGLFAGVFVSLVNKSYGTVFPLVGAGILLAVPAFVYTVYLSFLDRFGARALVLEQLMARPAIARAHRLLRKRLGRSLLVWLISIGVAIGLGIALACALALLALPAIFIVTWASITKSAALIPEIIVGVVILIPIALIVQGFLAAQMSTYWTVAYRRLDLDYPAPAAVPYAPLAPPT